MVTQFVDYQFFGFGDIHCEEGVRNAAGYSPWLSLAADDEDQRLKFEAVKNSADSNSSG
jgi:hypothetical protein